MEKLFVNEMHVNDSVSCEIDLSCSDIMKVVKTTEKSV